MRADARSRAILVSMVALAAVAVFPPTRCGVPERFVRPAGWSPPTPSPAPTARPGMVYIGGREYDQAEIEPVTELSIWCEGVALSARQCVEFYTQDRHPEGLEGWDPWTDSGFVAKALQELGPQIGDEEMRGLCESMASEAVALDEVNAGMASLLAFVVGMPARPAPDLEELSRRVAAYRKAHGAAWMSEPGYLPLLARLQTVTAESDRLWRQVLARDEELYGPELVSTMAMGDQRADDLIDQSYNETDHRRAIALLQKAVSYGDIGILPSKAYLELGYHYAELGEVDEAIDSYTRSIEAWRGPSTSAYYSRGELYYRQGEWEKARADLEQALALGLDSPWREQAQRWLDEMPGG